MDRYVVIGNPVAHSLSPAIHARFARQTGEAMEYATLLVPEGGFAEHAGRFFDAGGRGANVTLPFKEDAFAWAATASDRASLAQAANVLAARADGVHADNTDGAGLVADLVRNLGVALAGRRVLLLGAGGAARGVMGPLLGESPGGITVANRTVERARILAARFAPLGRVSACGLDAVAHERFDVVINATSGATKGEGIDLPAGLFAPGVFAYDMAYGPGARAFLAQARAGGARACDGLGMLVEQAAESFLLWRGTRPETRPVIDELRARAP